MSETTIFDAEMPGVGQVDLEVVGFRPEPEECDLLDQLVRRTQFSFGSICSDLVVTASRLEGG